jgi:hypothetical protein
MALFVDVWLSCSVCTKDVLISCNAFVWFSVT